MIEDYTDEHPCGIALNHSSTLRITDDSPPNQNQVNHKTTKPLLGKSKRRILSKIYDTTTGKRSYRVITDSSQDD